MHQSRPFPLQQTLDAALELESFEMASSHRQRVLREAVLREYRAREQPAKAEVMDQLMELVRCAMKDPWQQRMDIAQLTQTDLGLSGAENVVRKATCNMSATNHNHVNLSLQVIPSQ